MNHNSLTENIDFKDYRIAEILKKLSFRHISPSSRKKYLSMIEEHFNILLSGNGFYLFQNKMSPESIDHVKYLITAHYDNHIISSNIPNIKIFNNPLSKKFTRIFFALLLFFYSIFPFCHLCLIFLLIAVFLHFFPFSKRNVTTDDNSSGVVAACVAYLALKKRRIPVKLVLFDGEEEGFLGARKFAKKYSDIIKKNGIMTINFDMVGRGSLLFAYSNLQEAFIRKNNNVKIFSFKKRSSDEMVFEKKGLLVLGLGRADYKFNKRSFPWVHTYWDSFHPSYEKNIREVVLCVLAFCDP